MFGQCVTAELAMLRLLLGTGRPVRALPPYLPRLLETAQSVQRSAASVVCVGVLRFVRAAHAEIVGIGDRLLEIHQGKLGPTVAEMPLPASDVRLAVGRGRARCKYNNSHDLRRGYL